MADFTITQAASERHWCPTHWLDESVPELCSEPSGFVVQEAGGFRLRAADNEAGDIYDDPLEPGQIVSFCYTEKRGRVTVRVEEDGSWQATTPVPEASHFWIPGDTDALGDSLDDLMKTAADIEAFLPGEHDVHAYYWSDEFEFRFDGERFVPCAGAN